MPEMEIKATTDKGEGPSASVKIDFPDTVKELVAKYGEEAVLSRARASFVIDIQSLLRSSIKSGKKPAEIQQAVEEWVPGVKTRGKTQSEKAADLLSKLTDEEKAELLARFAAPKGAAAKGRGR